MELDREQIIKALECCLVESNCTNCPLHHQYEIDCLKYAGVKTLSLINKLTEDVEWSAKRILKADKKVAELTEENAELTRKLEIANLEIECKVRICESYMLQYGTVADKEVWLKKERADTVRKMQEIINERLDISVEGYSSEEVKSDVRDMVDQIAEEMIGGDNN